MGRFHDPRICQLFSMEPRTKQKYSCSIHTFMLTRGHLVGYTAGAIHMNQCSSQPYSHDTLLIQKLFIENNIHSNIIPKNTNTIHNIHTGTIHYSYQR